MILYFGFVILHGHFGTKESVRLKLANFLPILIVVRFKASLTHVSRIENVLVAVLDDEVGLTMAANVARYRSREDVGVQNRVSLPC